MLFMEIGGFDTAETPVIVSGTVPSGPAQVKSVALATNNTERQPELIIAAGFVGNGNETISTGKNPGWFDIAANLLGEVVIGPAYVDKFEDSMAVQGKVVNWPGTVTWNTKVKGGDPYVLIIWGFYNSQAQAGPQNLPDIVDLPTLKVVRRENISGGLIGSINMNRQRKASDWLKDFYASANAWPVWAGFNLQSISRDEVSKIANGATYVAVTAGGPVANLDANNGDFVGDSSAPIVQVDRKAQADAYNILQIEHISRSADYHQVITSQPDPASIALYGVRKAAPEVHHEIQDVAVARPLLGIMNRRQTMIRNLYTFTAQPKFALLLPGDLITINDPLAGINTLPVRIQSIDEDAKTHALKMTAEPFIYGCHDPLALTLSSTSPTNNPTDQNAAVAAVNAPIIFEPVPRLYANQNERQLWIVVSDSDTNYGGSFVMLSTDGGTTYYQVGMLFGNATTGVTVSNPRAAGTSPDTAHDLQVDLTESLGVLSNFSTNDEDNYVQPNYVEHGAGDIPYELMTYAIAVMTATNKYTLKATGTGNHLDRAVFGAPNAGGVGVSHAMGSRFAVLSQGGTGILKLVMDQQWIGVTLHFKFLPFNQYISGAPDITDPSVVDYTFTPTGNVGTVNPGGVPPELFEIN
jgi:hypothetical protein